MCQDFMLISHGMTPVTQTYISANSESLLFNFIIIIIIYTRSELAA